MKFVIIASLSRRYKIKNKTQIKEFNDSWIVGEYDNKECLEEETSKEFERYLRKEYYELFTENGYDFKYFCDEFKDYIKIEYFDEQDEHEIYSLGRLSSNDNFGEEELNIYYICVEDQINEVK